MSNWKSKIKEGYFYRIDSGSMIVDTGSGGAIKFGKRLEKDFSSEEIETLIQIFLNNKWVTLKQVTWEKK